MGQIRGWVAVCCLLVTGMAAAEPASETSIRKLLELTQAHKLVDSMRTEASASFGKAFDLGRGDAQPDAAQQAAIDRMKARMQGLLESNLDWETLEKSYVRIYRESFSEDEIQGMLAFYQTPAGKAVINKMPIVMQKTSAEMQDSFQSMIPAIQKIQADFESEIRAARKKG